MKPLSFFLVLFFLLVLLKFYVNSFPAHVIEGYSDSPWTDEEWALERDRFIIHN